MRTKSREDVLHVKRLRADHLEVDGHTVAGDELIIINTSASGTAAHTVTVAAGVTLDGTNDVATLDAPGDALHIVAVSATRWYILENIGSVGLS